MIKGKRLMRASLAVCILALAAAAVIGLMTVAGAASAGKNGSFLGSSAHVDGKGNLFIDNVNFPDPALLDFAVSADINRDGVLSTGEARTAKRLTFRGGDLSGVEFFTELTYLDCSWCGLLSIDLSANKKLAYLDCSMNGIASLDLSANTALTHLDVSLNPGITELSLSSNSALTELYCGGTSLTSLSLASNKELSRLDCGDNVRLASLDLSANAKLTYLDCSNNFFERGTLSALDLSSNVRLSELNCSYNSIETLTLSSASLKRLDCSNNALSSLDLSRTTSLEYLECADNKIKELDLSQLSRLTYLYCERNRLLSVDLLSNPILSVASLTGQESPVNVPMKSTDGRFIVDLRGVIAPNDPASITDVTGECLDDIFSGTFDAKSCAAAFEKNALYVTYFFDVALAGGGTQPMSVKAATGPVGKEYVSLTEKEVPDRAFREFLHQLLGADASGRADANAVKRTTVIDCSGLGISDLTGISIFTELAELYADNNSLSFLDLTKNENLVKVHCSHNELKELRLPVMRGIRSELDCSYNKLSSLSLKNEIRHIDCSHNELASLRIGSEYVSVDIYGGYYLDCSYNKLTSLDSSVAHSTDVYSGNTSYTYVVNTQTYSGVAIIKKSGGTYTLDLSSIAGGKALSNITSVRSKDDDTIKAGYNAETGIATFEKNPGDIVYTVQCFYKNDGSGVAAWGPEMDVTVTVLDGLVGDANGDGTVNNLDVLAIFCYVFDPVRYPIPRPDLADVDGSGSVDNRDSLAIFCYIFDSTQYPLE